METIIINKLQKVLNNNDNIDINLILNKIMSRLYPNITDDELVYLTNICDRIPYVQFRNTGGMLYAYRLVNAINLVGTQEEVLNVLKDAKEKSVPTFDIYRYHRFLSNLGLIGRFNKSFKVKI